MSVTTQELLNMFYEIQILKNSDEVPDEAILKQWLLAEQKIYEHLLKKLENIDEFVMKLNEDKAIIKAREDVYKKEIERLQTRERATDRSLTFFNEILMPAIISKIGKNNKLKTPTANYTFYKTWGKPIYNDIEIPEQFKSIQEIIKIDRAAVKKAAIQLAEQGKTLPGVIISLVNRIRRS